MGGKRMEVVFNARELERAVSSVLAAVPSRHVNEAQTGILIDASNESVSFTANNYDLAIRNSIIAQVIEPGKTLVSGKLFAELVKRLPGPDITVKEDKERNSVIVKCGSSDYRILTMDVHDFLPIEQVEQTNSVELDAAALREIYHMTAFAVGDDTKPVFTGINFCLKSGMLSATATNSHRLAIKKIPFEAAAGSIIIPPNALAVITRSIDAGEKVTMAWGRGKVWFTTENLYVSSRLIDGNFPDIDRVIPQTFIATVTIDRKQLLRAVERIALIGLQKIDKAPVFSVKLSVTDGVLTLLAEASYKGQAREELTAITTGESIDIAFNGSYITDCLQVLTSDKVVLSLTGTLKPAIITSEVDSSYVYVITPLRA